MNQLVMGVALCHKVVEHPWVTPFTMRPENIHIHEGDSNENLRSAIKIQNTARFSVSWQQCYSRIEELPTGGSTMQECNTTAQ
jgi:hypothetical protein